LITDFQKYNNNWYKPGRNILVRFLWMFVSEIWVDSWIPFSSLKIFFLRIFGAKIGKNVVVKPHVKIKYPWFLAVDDNVWIGEGAWIDNLGLVKIESNVCISQGALLICGNHNYKKPTFDLIVGDIIVKQGAWIGAKSVITGGSVLNSHSVITVGSVFSGISEEYTIYKGNPAVAIKKRAIRD
jgi:putative colanic acid biosynthesis acetyltransferase WcaF